MYNSQQIAEKIKETAKINKVPISKMLTDIGLGKSTITKMSSGADIYLQTLIKIAQYLNCSTDYLTGMQTDAISETDDEYRLVKAYRQLTDDGKRAILTTAELYATSPQYQKYTDNEELA